MEIIDKLAWIYVEDGRVLAARSKGKDLFFIPGGKREEGESDEQALTREIKEELSVDLDPDSLKFIKKFEGPAYGKPEARLLMSCYLAEHKGEIKPSAEIEELDWFKNKEKTEKTTPMMRIVLSWLKEKNFID